MNARAVVQEKYEIRPSDLSQSVVRVILVSAVVVWSLAHVSSVSFLAALNYPYVVLSLSYWCFSCLLFVWTLIVLRDLSPDSKLTIGTRISGIVTDLGAVSAYTAISGTHGAILYPIYLTCVIGYGYRFGVSYLYLSIIAAAIFLTAALRVNTEIAQNQSLVIAYYLGLFLVPLYSASLLRKHRDVLERLREVNAARSRFIANVSHELRTPLHAIISVTDILTEESDVSAEWARSKRPKLSMIGDSAKHLLNLVNRILDVASADSGKDATIQFETIDFYDVIISALRICEPKAYEKGIGFYWHIDPRVPRWISSSRDRLEEIVINTVGNAVKYTDSGYVSIKVGVIAESHCEQVSISVADTGIGISEKLLPNIFEPFTLGDDGAARRYSGSGLGLTITKQCVEFLKGSITYESTENVGTICKILLPVTSSSAPVNDDLSQIYRAILLSRFAPIRSEMEAFRKAGFECKVSDDLGEAIGLDISGAIMFLDESFAEHQKGIIEKLHADRPGCILVQYHRKENSKGIENVGFRSSVRAGKLEDLESVKGMFGIVDRRSRGTSSNVQVLAEKPARILVADDNQLNLRTAVLSLESAGHRVTTVTNGEDALFELEKNEFELALFDMHMPVMSGIEAAKIYQFVCPPQRQTPIVILTADATRTAQDAAIEAGAVAFLTKPIGAKEFRAAVIKYSKFIEGGEPLASRLIRSDIDLEIVNEVSIVNVREIDDLLELNIDRSEIVAMLKDFRIEALDMIRAAEHAARYKKFRDVEDRMHALKGSAGTVGATLLQVRAGQLENSARMNFHETYSEKLENLRAILKDSIAILIERVSRTPTG